MAFDMTVKDRRLRLVHTSDPYTQLKRGDEGTAQFIDSMGTLAVRWDSGSTLGLIPESGDRWEWVEDDEYKCIPTRIA